MDPLFVRTGRGPNMSGDSSDGTCETAAGNDKIGHIPLHPNREGANRTEDGGPSKVMLPRRVGEPRFGPQSYYYEASRTGVLPSGYPAAKTEERSI
jgi:hypothetical protein